MNEKRLAEIASVAADGVNGYNTLSAHVYCKMLNELLEDRHALAEKVSDIEKRLALEQRADWVKEEDPLGLQVYDAQADSTAVVEEGLPSK